MQPIEILKCDYESTLAFIDKCDDHMFKIKNWALITTSAVIAFAISRDKDLLVLVNLGLAFAFLYLELIYKLFQDSAIAHANDAAERIDQYLLDASKTTLTTSYTFGFGRGLEYPDVKAIFQLAKSHSRRHIIHFYLLIALISLGALVIGWCVA